MAVKRGIMGYRRSLISTPTYMDGLLVNNYWDSARCPVSYALSNNNLSANKTSGGSAWVTGFAKYSQPLDRPSVWEIRLDAVVGNCIPGFSIIDPIAGPSSGFPGGGGNTGGVYWIPGAGGTIFKYPTVASPISALPVAEAEWAIGDVIGFGYDPILGTMKLWRNGIPVYAGAPVFTGIAGKKVTPSLGIYGIGDKATILSGKMLKYKYSGYSLSNEGTVTPSEGQRYFDSYRKPAGTVISDNGYSIYAPTNPSASGYISNPFPMDKKTIIEFITQTTAQAAYIGFMFDEANKTGPRAGVIGQIVNSAAMVISGSTRGNFAANGCTQHLAFVPGGTDAVKLGDVFAFGYDPVARTIKGWKNGVALNSGNPIWSNLPVAEVSAAYGLNQPAARVRLNPDGLRYNYGDYTQ